MRNAKLDKAKLQARGIWRKSTGTTTGDYRPLEGEKPCYLNHATPATYDLAVVRRFPSDMSMGQDHRKRAGCDPRQRAGMMAAGTRSAAPHMAALVTWASYAPAESRLIPRA